MRAGTLRERVTVLVPVESNDPALGPVAEYQETDTLWASVRPVSQAEGGAVSVTTEIAYEVRVRHLPTLDNRCRLLWRGRTLDVTEALADERRRELTLKAFHHPDRAEVTS